MPYISTQPSPFPELGKLEYYLLKECFHCKGSGVVPAYPVDTGGGQSTSTTICPACDGEGKVIFGEIWSVD